MVSILVVTNMYPPHHYGGYELSCRDVVTRLEARGHNVTVLTSTTRVAGVADPPGEREAGIRRDLEWYWDDHVILDPPPRRRLALERANQRRLAEAIDAARPDVVSIWHMGAMSLNLLTTLAESRLPVLYYVCDDWLEYGTRHDAWTRLFRSRPRMGRLVRRLTGVPTVLPDVGASGPVLFVSERTRRHAEARSPWSFPESSLVYTGIDRDDFPQVPVPAEPPPFGWRLLYVGRIDERKGIGTAVRALVHLRSDATLGVVGSGDTAHLADLHRLVDELGLRDRVWFDSVDRSELRRVYAEADAFLFTSTWNEPFGLTPVEAMACATPVIATGRGGSGEFLVDGGNCLLYDAGDAGALAAAVVRLSEDGDLRLRLVEGGARTAGELTIDRLADVLEEWHVAVASGFSGGRPADRPPPGR